MPGPTSLPPALAGRAFTTQQAKAHGLTDQELRGKRFVRIHRGVHRYASTAPTLDVQIQAARLLLPHDAALSHFTALWWHGVDLRSPAPLHFSTNTTSQTRLDGVVLHRRRGTLHPQLVNSVPTLGPDRTLVDCATRLGLVDLVRAGDRLVRLGLTTPDVLAHYVMDVHLDGVVRARRATPLVRERVDSVTESDVRLMLMFARLPEPEVNTQILDQHGDFVARGDLPYRKFKVLVEYDGWHHERDALQRQKDHLRRERLDAAGWRVLVITAADMRQPVTVIRRVYEALIARGYTGPRPVISDVWKKWFIPRDL